VSTRFDLRHFLAVSFVLAVIALGMEGVQRSRKRDGRLKDAASSNALVVTPTHTRLVAPATTKRNGR
jgi:hypothetical protein